MESYLFAKFSPIFVDKMLLDVIRGLNRVIFRPISIEAYNAFIIAALTEVKDDFVEDVLVLTGCM